MTLLRDYLQRTLLVLLVVKRQLVQINSPPLSIQIIPRIYKVGDVRVIVPGIMVQRVYRIPLFPHFQLIPTNLLKILIFEEMRVLLIDRNLVSVAQVDLVIIFLKQLLHFLIHQVMLGLNVSFLFFIFIFIGIQWALLKNVGIFSKIVLGAGLIPILDMGVSFDGS